VQRRWSTVAVAALLAIGSALWLKSRLEHSVRARIEAGAVHHGMVARIGAVHVGLWPLVRLENVDLDPGHGVRLHADAIAATWPGRLRLAVRAARLTAPAGITVSAPATAWNMTGIHGAALQLALVEPQAGLAIGKTKEPTGTAWSLEAHGLDLSHLADVRRDGYPLVDGGLADGRVVLHAGSDALRFHVSVGARGARLRALSDTATDEPQLGDATDVALRFDGTWQRAAGTIEIPELHATVAKADLSGSIALTDLGADPAIDLALGVQRLDFAQLLQTSGLAVPESLGLAPGASHDLGVAAISLHVRGRMSEPAKLDVTQKISFTPPREMPPGILRLRGDFIFSNEEGANLRRPIHVSPDSPDFIALRDVPPLFVRTLLIAEDAGFYGHRGIDLRELPRALLTNWSRGGASRGASTITQQLAKNLFLSRDKQLGRKVEELAITFLLESALGKQRILEIYLNIIEWGPDLHGLRPAALTYFGREPQELTPGEMAFLVSIIPGPIKYQSSFAQGMPGPGLQSLIDELLAKLRSVDAISEDEYQRALRYPIVLPQRRP